MAMREVLYRGKSDGKWYFGDLWHLWDGRTAIRLDGEAYPIAIDPETRGEFTGLTDKSGVKIFEGDIVKAFKHNETPFIFQITFRAGCFWYGNWNFIEFLDKFRNTEVIGNIFDNPELVGGEQNELSETECPHRGVLDNMPVVK